MDNTIISVWFWYAVLTYIFCARKKKTDIANEIITGLVMAALHPVTFLFLFIFLLWNQHRLKYLKKYWLCLAWNRAYDYSYGYRDKQKGYNYKKKQIQ
jgi:hypothetical protein